jgi:hypothetical protein
MTWRRTRTLTKPDFLLAGNRKVGCSGLAGNRKVGCFVALAALAVLVSACGIGGGTKGSGAAKLTVTRDFGGRMLLQASVPKVPKNETVMRFLQRRARTETRYGGRFVSAIDGVHSSERAGRREDWFYYVNGIEAETGAAERQLQPGDRVWWDHHDWTDAMRVPAVVGSFPEPFLHGTGGKRYPVRIDCADDAADACRTLADRLQRAGIEPSTAALGAAAGKEVLRFLVGEWKDVRRDAAARQIEQGPAKSGVFARFGPDTSGYELELLNRFGEVSRRVGGGGGGSGSLVAATRFEEQQPSWLVTGTDRLGLERAVRLVGARSLRDRFAVASAGGGVISLPLPVATVGGVGR